MDSAFQLDIAVPAGTNILQAMVLQSGLSADALQEAATKGAVWIGQQQGKHFGRRRRIRALDTLLSSDALINLNYNEDVLSQASLPFHCVYPEINYGIWHKPSGMLCQGSKWSDHTTATEIAARQLSKPCHLVHRLDKAAEGLLVLAYTKNATRKLASLFEQRQISKTYHVWVGGRFTPQLPLEITTALDGKQARTVVKAARWHTQSESTLLEISIETGRKHQIRKHLAEIGFPVLGDRLYGEGAVSGIDLQLTASALSFTCPFSGKAVAHSLEVAQAPAGTLAELKAR